MNDTASSNTKTKSWFAKHKMLTGIIAVVVFFIIIGVIAGGDSAPSTSPTPQNGGSNNGQTLGEQIQPTQAPPPPPAEKIYQEVFTFKGNGTKKSEPFTITGERFKIAYDCDGDLCQAFLYKVGTSFPNTVIMNAAGPLKDETIIYGSGEYYIEANTLGTYTMSVSDYK